MSEVELSIPCDRCGALTKQGVCYCDEDVAVKCPACRGRGAVDSGSVYGGSVSCVACRSTGRISGERVWLLGEALLALRDVVEGRDSKAAEVLRRSGLRLAEPAPAPVTAADWNDADRKR